jgi:hypothetical protein
MDAGPERPYTEVPAFSYAGKTYVREIDAIRAVLAVVLGNTGLADTVQANAALLVPILNRMMELEASDAD